MTSIGEKLKSIRQEKKFSLRHLAEKAGVSASLICEIENGRVNPTVNTLFNISNALDLPAHYFLQESSAGPSASFEESLEAKEETPNPGMAEKQPLKLASAALATLATTVSGPVVHPEERAKLQLTGGITWLRLTPGQENGVEFVEICYKAGATTGDEMHYHNGREFGVVLEGELTLDLGFERHVLRPGDSIAYDSTTPHRLSNNGPGVMRAVWVNVNR
ncbi:MAG TPA: cupin domain-containing protein [Chloroflexia bacterium]|nr:cupin domain-containing protein [Chloroflexia bacterium]